MSRDFHTIRAWQLADDLAVAVYRATAAFPRHEIYGLTSQLRRSAYSVPSNIAEGCCRSTRADYLRFLDMALGSLSEARYQLHLARRLDYLPAEVYAALEAQANETGRTLNGLMKAVRAELPAGASPSPPSLKSNV
jgi:four helix bundle protein